jgi:hypothetical protein
LPEGFLTRKPKPRDIAAVHDVIRAGLVGEEVVHRVGAAAHLPKGSLQDIGGADGLPPFRKKIIKMQAVKQVPQVINLEDK